MYCVYVYIIISTIAGYKSFFTLEFIEFENKQNQSLMINIKGRVRHAGGILMVAIKRGKLAGCIYSFNGFLLYVCTHTQGILGIH